MSKDEKTNVLVRQLIIIAYNFGNMGHVDAGILVLDTARRAIKSSQPTAPIHDYVDDLRVAGLLAFGHGGELADLSKRKQIEALNYWTWFRDVTGERMEDCIEIAIGVLVQDDVTWATRKEFIQNCLNNHPIRRDLVGA